MAKKLSRALDINVETCVKNTGNQFDLVLVGAELTRELRSKHRNKAEPGPGVVDALLKIQEGGVDPKVYLAKVGQNKIQKR